jgi:hypothetical protein
MATLLISGLRATATITGTGSYTGLADVDNWRSFAGMTNADRTYVTAIAEDGTFEIFLATKSGGSSPALARTSIVVQTDGTTDPVNWDTNTPVTLYSTVPGEIIPLLNGTNPWAADQTLTSTNKLKFGDGGQYIYSSGDGDLDIVADAAVAKFQSGLLNLYKTDDGATAGPDLNLYRTSASPAVGDDLGSVNYWGKDSAGNTVLYGKITGEIQDPTAGAHTGRLGLFVPDNNGSNQEERIRVENGSVKFFSSFNAAPNTWTFYKSSADSGASAGLELNMGSSQVLYLTGQSATGIFDINRLTSDGKLITFRRAGTEQGSIGVSSGVVSLTGAVLSHPSEWADGRADPDDMRGMVVCSADGVLDDDCGAHVLVLPSRRESDPTVYGVLAGRVDGRLQVDAAGTGMIRVIGPVRRGDLLETSDVPGCARAQADDLVRSSTVAKATQSSPDNSGWRLVPCTLMAG